MKTRRTAIILLLVSLMPSMAFGQDADKDAVRPDFRKLPKPLEKISGNMKDLEDGNLFRITDVRLGPAGYFGDDAIVWTLRANRSVSFRHIETFLRDFRDARFYAREKNMRRAIISTLLFYSGTITVDAANSEFLPKDGPIDIWIYLDRSDIQILTNAMADTIELRTLRQRAGSGP